MSKMLGMDKPGTNYLPLVIVILATILPVLYAGSYFALTEKPAWHGSIAPSGEIVRVREARYRIGGSVATRAFWPMEQIDRKLRPKMWDYDTFP